MSEKSITMFRIKTIFTFAIIGVFLFLISACCDEGFHYKWHSIILQPHSNGEPVTETAINQEAFSLRVHLISTKSANSGIQFPRLFNYAYASDCKGKYLNIDKIDDIDILLITYENGLEVQNVVTFLFEAALDFNPGDKMKIFDLPDILNNESSKPVEYFDLTLKENFDHEINGQFMLLLTLSDDRELTDISETLTLKL